MKTQLQTLLDLLEVDEPAVVKPLQLLADKYPDAPLAEVWLRARRLAYARVK